MIADAQWLAGRSQSPTRDALLTAAAELVALRGSNVSLAQIGALAGTSRGAVTHIFESKNGLLAALADLVGDEWSGYNLSSTSTTFEAWLDAWVEPLLGSPGRQRLPIILLQEAMAVRAEFAGAIRSHRRNLHGRIAVALNELNRGGQITSVAAAARAELVLGGVFGLFALHFCDGEISLERGYSELRSILAAAPPDCPT